MSSLSPFVEVQLRLHAIILKLLPRQSVTSMFVVLIISNMQVATLPHKFGVYEISLTD